MLLCVQEKSGTIEERKQLETTRVTPSYKVTIVLS